MSVLYVLMTSTSRTAMDSYVHSSSSSAQAPQPAFLVLQMLSFYSKRTKVIWRQLRQNSTDSACMLWCLKLLACACSSTDASGNKHKQSVHSKVCLFPSDGLVVRALRSSVCLLLPALIAGSYQLSIKCSQLSYTRTASYARSASGLVKTRKESAYAGVRFEVTKVIFETSQNTAA